MKARILVVTVAALLLGSPTRGEDLAPPTYSDAHSVPWDDLSTTKGRTWTDAAAAAPDALARFAPTVRMKRVFYSDDFRLGYIMLAPGAIYPSHAHPAPEIYHVLSGTTEWTVEGQTRIVGPGGTVYMKPNAPHRIRVISKDPMRAIWAQWAPGGDQSSMDRGYRLLEALPELPDTARFDEEPQFLPVAK